MWSSTTLPRQRPNDAPPPPPPHNKSATLQRIPAKSIDVNKLRSDIEILSQQLEIVKARLESALAEQDESIAHVNELSRDNSIDSRMSTALFSNRSQDSSDPTPTPQPTEIFIQPSSLNKPLSLSASHLAHMNTDIEKKNKRLSMCLTSSTSHFIPTVKRRETISKVDEITKEIQAKIGKMKRTESLSVEFGKNTLTSSSAPIPPPKPTRTFKESATMGRYTNHYKSKSSTSSFMSSSVAFLSMCNHREFVEAINKRFTQGQCWFSRGGQLFFVNPFNNVTSPRCPFYSVIPTITSSLFESKNSTLFLRGVSGSGKSHIAELVCLDIVKRFDSQGHMSQILKNALIVLRPFISANNTYNNRCSKALLHYIFQTRENRLNKITLLHFPIESMSRGCRANIFAMVANDLSEAEKEVYKIAGFRLRENCKNYGNFEDIRKGLTVLGIDVNDILKVVSACILLNNLSFKTNHSITEIDNLADLEDASSLLGISTLALYRFLVSEAEFDIRLLRDNFVTAIYSRTVKSILDKINRLLESLADVSDRNSVITDSGVSMETFNDNTHTIHIIDIPGYVRSAQNSLNELIVNATNDIVQCTDSDMVHEMLKSVEMATNKNENWNEITPKTMKHCAEFFEIDYDMRLMLERNFNLVSRDLINLFDHRSCTFQYAINLFATDVESIIVDDNFIPTATNWPFQRKTIIQNVMDCIQRMKKCIGETSSQQIICLKSNDSLEYARVHENGLGYQLNLFRSVVASSAISTKRPNSSCISSRTASRNQKLPPVRQYAIRDGRKHHFPQRRNVVIDYQDPSNGVVLQAGEVVKVIGFSGECYLLENARRDRATIPLSFTDKSIFLRI